MVPLLTVLQVALPAALVAGSLLLVGTRGWSAKRTAGAAWAVALALGLGYAVGHASIDGTPPWPPREATHRIFFLALAAGLCGWLDATSSAPAALRWLARAALAAGVPWWFLKSFVDRWERSEAWTTVGALAAGLLVAWSALGRLARRRPGASLPLALWTVAALGSVALLQSGNLTYALLAGALAGTLGAALVLSWRAPELRLTPAAAPLVTVLACLWMGGFYLSELPARAALLLAAAPLATWLGELRVITKRPAWQGVLLRALLAAVPAGAALAIAIAEKPPPNPYYP